jgi:hypothetical protein
MSAEACLLAFRDLHGLCVVLSTGQVLRYLLGEGMKEWEAPCEDVCFSDWNRQTSKNGLQGSLPVGLHALYNPVPLSLGWTYDFWQNKCHRSIECPF